jgi:signal transduction histidine kinase
VVADDITERRRLEVEARELEQRMERVARLESISVLAGGVAHDFNNILAAILGNASFARDGLPHGSPLSAHLEEVERAARRAADLTGKLLAYAGKTERRPAPLRLDELAADASDVFTSSMQSRLAVWVETADPVWVRGDLAQLRQVALTLMTNAAEALSDRSHGRITVRASVATLSGTRAAGNWWPAPLEDGRYGCLEVSDDGPGIEPKVMEQLFIPFASTKFLGRGLGLAAALGIARAHRGAMEVESTPGRGSAFRIWLPLITPTEATAG